MKLATFISAGAILASAGFGSAAKHVETNAVSVLANDGAGDPAGSRTQGGGLRVLQKSEPGAGDARRLTGHCTATNGIISGIAGDLIGKILEPGTYTSTAAISLTGTLQLDACGKANAEWKFIVGAAVTTAATTKIEIINPGIGTHPVHWDVTGAISIGAGSTVIGSMTATDAIALGAGATSGDLVAGGAIALGAGATSGNLKSGGAVSLGADATGGDIEALGAITLGANAVAQSFTTDAAITLGAAAYAVGYLAGELGGVTLIPGNYDVASAVTLTGILTLKCTADPSNWIFTIGGALTTAAASTMVFEDCTTQTVAVTWKVTGAITTGAGSTAVGSMEADGAITLGAGATSEALTAGGAITLGALAVYESVTVTAGGAITYGAGAHSTSDPPPLPADLVGETYVPGVDYKTAVATSLTGILTLDCAGLADAKFTFTIGGAFTTAAGSKMEFKDCPTGVDAPVVKWLVTGAISLGANSIAIGLMEADGAINVGAFATTGYLKAGGALNVGAGAVYESAVYAGAPAWGAGSHKKGEKADLFGDLIGQTFKVGIYKAGAAISQTGTIYLDCESAASATEFIFNFGGAFTTAAASKMELLNCPNAAVVTWDVTGAISLGAGSIPIGTMKATGAIAVGAGVTAGKLDAGGAIAVGADSVYESAVHGGALTLGAGAHKIGELADLPANMGGMTLPPGTHTAPQATGLTGILTLDDTGVTLSSGSPQWVIEIVGAFTTAASSGVVFKSGAAGTNANVKWNVIGASTIGAGSIMVGNMHADGAITVGAGARVGEIDAWGAITVGTNANYDSADTSAAKTIGIGATEY
jgi:hypothetical protein